MDTGEARIIKGEYWVRAETHAVKLAELYEARAKVPALIAQVEQVTKERDALSDKLETERALTDGAHKRARTAETALAAANAPAPSSRRRQMRHADLIARLEKRTVEKLPANWKIGRKCPECGAGADRPKCMWDMGGSCPRHDASNYEPSPYIEEPDRDCSEAAAALRSLTADAGAQGDTDWRENWIATQAAENQLIAAIETPPADPFPDIVQDANGRIWRRVDVTPDMTFTVPSGFVDQDVSEPWPFDRPPADPVREAARVLHSALRIHMIGMACVHPAVDAAYDRLTGALEDGQ